MNKLAAFVTLFCAMALSGEDLGCFEDMITCRSVLAEKANGDGDCIRMEM